jgi:nucleoside-diphosphate-sugar epimerase
VFNVANGKQTSLLDLIAILNRQLKIDIQPEFAPPRVGDVRESLADITQARKWLKYEPQVDFETGLSRSIEYYRKLVGGK